MDECEFYLEDLKSKFAKINPDEYYLAYSGGRDSHFLLWFIREYLHETRIPAVYNNTGMDIPEIRERARANADVVLKPTMHPFEVKEKYGIPLASKRQDDYIYRYQQYVRRGISEADMPYTIHLKIIRDREWKKRDGSVYTHLSGMVNLKVCKALRSGALHKVSSKCCEYSKKRPGDIWAEANHRKPIIGIMREESEARKKMSIQGCFTKKGIFYPIHDLTEELKEKIEKRYDIPVPTIYNVVKQTGCAGCPYGLHNRESFNYEMNVLPESQRAFATEYFKESYEFRGYQFEPLLFT